MTVAHDVPVGMSEDGPLYKITEEYGFSAPYAGVKRGEHALDEGKSVREAGKIAANQALGQIQSSGADKQRLMRRFHRLQILLGETMDVIAEVYDVDDPREDSQ